jgi:hypothetical protein
MAESFLYAEPLKVVQGVESYWTMCNRQPSSCEIDFLRESPT